MSRRPLPGPDRGDPIRRVPGIRQRRLARTIVLGTIALAAGLYWLAVELRIDADELLDYALTSVLLIGGAVVLALGVAWLFTAIRRLRRRQ